jgi:hypothetical protein
VVSVLGRFRKQFCHCGSGKEAGFCNHKGALTQGTTENGRRTSGGSKIVKTGGRKPTRKR